MSRLKFKKPKRRPSRTATWVMVGVGAVVAVVGTGVAVVLRGRRGDASEPVVDDAQQRPGSEAAFAPDDV